MSRPLPRDLAGGDPATPPRDARILGATILVMWGPFAWAGLGAGAYIAQSALCVHRGGAGLALLLPGLAALSLALAVLGLAFARRMAPWLLGGDVAPATAGFLIALARAMGALSVLGILWLGLTVLALTDCPALR